VVVVVQGIQMLPLIRMYVQLCPPGAEGTSTRISRTWGSGHASIRWRWWPLEGISRILAACSPPRRCIPTYDFLHPPPPLVQA
jgi:hypothetical protein